VAELKHTSHHCYHVEFGRSALKCVDINIGGPPKWGALELRCLAMESVANPKIHAFSPYVRVTISNSVVVVRQRVFAYIEGNPQIVERLSPTPLR